MGDEATLSDIKAFAAGLGPWAHLATVGTDGTPDVVPVHPCWGPAPGTDDGPADTLWIMCGNGSVKAKNVGGQPRVALHWQVTEKGDGVEMWGSGTLLDDLETKHRLWQGVFDYDLNAFAPGGPDGSPDTGFLAVAPDRAVIIVAYGAGGIRRWRA